MIKIVMTVFLAATCMAGTSAFAANALTADQLVSAAHSAVKDYATVSPDMSQSISGIRVTTVGNNAQVLIQMNSDGMSMSAKYVCSPQGNDMSCNLQQ